MEALLASPQVEGVDVGEDPQHRFDVLSVEVVAIRLFVRAIQSAKLNGYEPHAYLKDP